MRKSFLKFSLITIMMVFLGNFSVFAAQEDYSNTWWINLGAGAGNVFGYDYEDDFYEDTDHGGVALTASFNYAVTEHQLLTLRTSRSEADLWSFVIVEDIFYDDVENLDAVYDIGVLYGLMEKNKYFLASISAGLAYTAIEFSQSENVCVDNTCSSVNHSDRTQSTIGVPFEAQLFWTPTDVFGIGVIGLANINSEASYAAGLLAIQVGNLR
ncbi:MAG: hypothetical protein WC748_00605 [Legionellales bacterium]